MDAAAATDLFHECFEKEAPSLPEFLRVTGRSGLDRTDMVASLECSCRELMDPRTVKPAAMMQQPRSRNESLNFPFEFVGTVLYTHLPTVLMDTMRDGGPVLREYKGQLARIGKIESGIARIRAVYDLVSERQGKYNAAAASPLDHLVATPHRTLEHAKATGSGGACRDFAILLYWSLLNVQRSPTYVSRLGELDENSFSVRYMISPSDLAHAWVEVEMPHGRGNSLSFESFQLDTTVGCPFTPLYPRKSGIVEAERAQIYGQCARIAQCLNAKH